MNRTRNIDLPILKKVKNSQEQYVHYHKKRWDYAIDINNCNIEKVWVNSDFRMIEGLEHLKFVVLPDLMAWKFEPEYDKASVLKGEYFLMDGCFDEFRPIKIANDCKVFDISVVVTGEASIVIGKHAFPKGASVRLILPNDMALYKVTEYTNADGNDKEYARNVNYVIAGKDYELECDETNSVKAERVDAFGNSEGYDCNVWVDNKICFNFDMGRLENVVPQSQDTKCL